MDVLENELRQLEAVRTQLGEEFQFVLPAKNNAPAKQPNQGDKSSISGSFSAAFNVRSTTGNDNGIALNVCRIMLAPEQNVADAAAQQQKHAPAVRKAKHTKLSIIRQDKKLKNRVIHNLPKIRIEFCIVVQTKRDQKAKENRFQLSVESISAPWLPKVQRAVLMFKLRQTLLQVAAAGVVGGVGDGSSSSENAAVAAQNNHQKITSQFNRLFQYVEHEALRDMFGFTQQAQQQNSLTLISKYREGHLRGLCKTRTQQQQEQQQQQQQPVAAVRDDFQLIAIDAEKRKKLHILLCDPWWTWQFLISKDKIKHQPQQQPPPAAQNLNAAERLRIVQVKLENLQLNLVAGPSRKNDAGGAAQPKAAAAVPAALSPTASSSSTDSSVVVIKATKSTPEIIQLTPTASSSSRTPVVARRRLRERKQACEICLEDKTFPTDFYRLNKCQHAFCRDCLHRAVAIKVQEGDIKTISCLSFECKKPIDFGDIKTLLTPREFERFDNLLLEVELASWEDVEICPNKACGMQYIIDAVQLARDEFQNAQCPHCAQVICLLCKQLLTGGGTGHRCHLSGQYLQEIMDEYEAAPNGSAARTRLESIYSRQKLQNMLDDRRSEREVEQNKKKCPKCRAPCEKVEGCNKVTCKCGSVWCWLCRKEISAEGYGHFQQQSCAGRLWEGVPGAENGGRGAQYVPRAYR